MRMKEHSKRRTEADEAARLPSEASFELPPQSGMRVKEHPENPAKRDGPRFFARALQCIGLHQFRLYLHGFREYSFPEKRNGWNDHGLIYPIRDK